MEPQNQFNYRHVPSSLPVSLMTTVPQPVRHYRGNLDTSTFHVAFPEVDSSFLAQFRNLPTETRTHLIEGGEIPVPNSVIDWDEDTTQNIYRYSLNWNDSVPLYITLESVNFIQLFPLVEVEEACKTIAARVDSITMATVKATAETNSNKTARQEFRMKLQESLQPLQSDLGIEWHEQNERTGPDDYSGAINRMLSEALGVGRANPPRDIETTQIIIDTLCETSIPYTLRFLSFRLSESVPKPYLPVPSERFIPVFTEFWNNVNHNWFP